MATFIPTPAYPDRMPIDISFVFADEKPAGKHGFCQAAGEQLRFEDGTLARFWGVNINGACNFPTHEYAHIFARRIAQAGCNLVRFHQMDAEWATTNMFAFNKGPRLTSTREFDERSMERLDYLIHVLKQEGIYIYLDMMTYRKFKEKDGLDRVHELRDSAKPFCMTNEHLMQLQEEFYEKLWTHYNPYTGLQYKDDPVFVMTEVVNECDLVTMKVQYNEGEAGYTYCQEVRAQFGQWLKENNIDFDYENCNLQENIHPILDFKVYAARKYFCRMRDYLRSIGVKIPIAGTNWSKTASLVPANQDMELMDNHIYFHRDWDWTEDEHVLANIRINGQRSIMEKQSPMRLNGKPMFISEWDMPWPNSFRAEAPIYYAAMCALQDWSGMAIHTYAYSTDLDKMQVLGKEISSEMISNIAYRSGVFSTWNDPAKFGLFYHAALIVRRGDVSPANKKLGVTMPSIENYITDAYRTGLEMHRLTTVLDGMSSEGCEEVVPADTVFTWDDNDDLVRSDNGQMWRSLSKRLGGIDTPKTKVLYGRLYGVEMGKDRPTKVSGMKVHARTDFGVVALSSLTDDPIETSPHMLLSTIGRARNTHAEFDGDKMVALGEAPITSEVIRATITIDTQRKDLSVWAIGPEGYYVGKLPVKYENGTMTFTLGNTCLASYYLIVAD